MPVGRTDDQDDGKPLRVYRGKPQPLGTLTEWVCPSCREKVSGTAYEAGCPHCGVNTPGQPQPEPPRPEPVAVPASQVQPQPGPRPGMASRPDVGRRPVEAPSLVVTRIVQYICKPGHEEQLEQVLQRALVGHRRFDWGSITAAIVDDASPRQQDILGLASRQPGVWLGGPDQQRGPSISELVQAVTRPLVRYEEAPGRDEVATALPFVGRTGMEAPIVPDQGPQFSRMDQEMARVLVQACGVKIAYTLALALQTFAAANDDSDPLVANGQDCYALANAIMQFIPKDYVEPDLPPPPPPNEARQAPSEDVQARIAAIQQGSKPTASFRE